MERFAHNRSHPMQPGATIALLMSNRQDVFQQIRLWALLSDLRTCRNEYFIRAHIYVRTGMLTHALLTLPPTAVQPFSSFW
jgi:hypothetical protein